MPVLLRILLIAAAALYAGLAAPGVALGQSTSCPSTSFLRFGDLVYASAAVPASVRLEPGDALGAGEVDEPTRDDPCKRGRRDATVVGIVGVDPGVAVLLEGEARLAFVLGGRCSGYDEQERWSCLLEPLSFRGATFTGIRYPAEPAPRGELELGEELGQAKLGGESVTVRAIGGVDPSLAVAADGRPSEAFVAVGVCPYERLDNRPVADDLPRCLRAPMWFTFAPPGGKPAEEITAHGDRTASGELDGAKVELVRLRVVADVIPVDGGNRTPIGTLKPGSDRSVTLDFVVPDLPEGLYEAVVRCEGCAATFGGRTEFPSGSILVLKKSGGSSSLRLLYIVAFALLVVLAAASVVMWRRGYRIGRRRRPT